MTTRFEGVESAEGLERLNALGQADVLAAALADVSRIREASRRRRVRRLCVGLFVTAVYLAIRAASGNPVEAGLPSLPDDAAMWLPPVLLISVLLLVVAGPLLFAGRSPHVLYRPSEITTSFADVKGMGIVLDEVVKSLNLFLGFKTFRDQMGGTPRRALLFEGLPGTGKTYMAKAMAREAGVPFLFVSASAFQSMYYGQTNRKIRAYFRALRKAARQEGGAIGFIEEIDAIGGARANMRATPRDDGQHGAMQVDAARSEGIAGVVNELLIQMQSFDEPTLGGRFRGFMVDRINRWLPDGSQLRKAVPQTPNCLVIAATNRAADLDPALLRPGRFDRSIHFDLPSRKGRREIIDYYLAKKAHVADLDRVERRDQFAAMTFGYSPVMIEHLFDEALVWALRDNRTAMDWADVQQAKMTEEIGLKQPVEYTDEDKRIIATHEGGHAVTAYLVGRGRKLEVLSIIKRKDALGLLAHSETEERFTSTRSEVSAMIKIAMGGMVAEELFFGESGTGPAGDLAAATRTAAAMVGAFGMAGSLISVEAVEPGFITEGLVAKVLGNEDMRRSVEHILESAKQEVRTLLDQNRHLVEALRDELLAREELIGDEIIEVLEKAQAQGLPVIGA
ncbi:MAG TPA: AAA family ATPase [Acidimicrobiia bacterium]|nr:AAA family ATPase [Acidimicrobiia bacterium]